MRNHFVDSVLVRLRLIALFLNWLGSILPIPDMTQVETLFQCVIVEDDARSGDWGHDWPHVLNRPHDRDNKPLKGMAPTSLRIAL